MSNDLRVIAIGVASLAFLAHFAISDHAWFTLAMAGVLALLSIAWRPE